MRIGGWWRAAAAHHRSSSPPISGALSRARLGMYIHRTYVHVCTCIFHAGMAFAFREIRCCPSWRAWAAMIPAPSTVTTLCRTRTTVRFAVHRQTLLVCRIKRKATHIYTNIYESNVRPRGDRSLRLFIKMAARKSNYRDLYIWIQNVNEPKRALCETLHCWIFARNYHNKIKQN